MIILVVFISPVTIKRFHHVFLKLFRRTRYECSYNYLFTYYPIGVNGEAKLDITLHLFKQCKLLIRVFMITSNTYLQHKHKTLLVSTYDFIVTYLYE